MFITASMWSILHIATKVMYSRSPEMTGYDTCSFMGYGLVPFYYIYAKYKGVNVNFFSFEFNTQLLLIARIAVGLLNNVCIFTGLRYISVGKGILIFSLSPLFWTIIAGLLLREKITILSVILTLCSVGGVYLLTLNQPSDPVEASHEIIGYSLFLWSSWLYGLLFVIFRKMNLKKIDTSISPLYLGFGTMGQTIFVYFFIPSQLNFGSYDKVNLACLIIVLITVIIGQYSMIAANKYSAASKMAPIGYAENVFTLLADAVVFNYHFILYDMLGIIVIVICLAIPIIIKLRESSKT